jgi:hypothetical protein
MMRQTSAIDRNTSRSAGDAPVPEWVGDKIATISCERSPKRDHPALTAGCDRLDPMPPDQGLIQLKRESWL